MLASDDIFGNAGIEFRLQSIVLDCFLLVLYLKTEEN